MFIIRKGPTTNPGSAQFAGVKIGKPLHLGGVALTFKLANDA